MKLTVQTFFILVATLLINCKKESTEVNSDNSAGYKLTVNYKYGADLSPTAYKNIYVIWLKSDDPNFIQNIGVCKKLIVGGLSGTALPYWKSTIYPNSETTQIDAVTGATKANQNFVLVDTLKNSALTEFTIYVETDRSYDPNDWFSDQPALLYSAKIKLSDNVSEYELHPIGWTPNENTDNIINNTPFGQLQTEMRYITHHKEGSTFGSVDDNGATKMVNKITVTVEAIPKK